MKLFNCLLFVVLSFLNTVCWNGRHSPTGVLALSAEYRKIKDTWSYLKRYGYLKVDPSKGSHRPMSPDDIATALGRFQVYMGLPVTENYDDNTMNAIYHPRCGAVDPVDQMTGEHNSHTFTLFGGKWNKTELTYKIRGSASGISKQTAAGVIREAFDLYSRHTSFTFSPVSRKESSDVEIRFTSAPDDPSMDGTGGSVGRAYPPLANSRYTGKIYLDADEHYSVGETDGTPLLSVVAHQIGHVLGLGHTSNHNSIMTPCVRDSSNLQLVEEDLAALDFLYGNPSNSEDTTKEPEVSRHISDLCKLPSYDVITMIDGYFFIFKNDKYWKVSSSGDLLTSDDGEFINTIWPDVTRQVNVVYQNSLGHVVIVKGNKYYEYDTNGFLFSWAPKTTQSMNLPKKPDAGFSVRETGFFIRGNKLWFIDEVSRETHPESPKSIQKLWGLSLGRLDSAFLWNGFLYLINGREYTRLEASTSLLDEEGSRNFAEDFLGC